MLVTRGCDYIYLTCGEGDIVAAVMCRPAITQAEIDQALWSKYGPPMNTRASRKTRIYQLNKKLRPFGVEIRAENHNGEFRYSLIT